LRKAWPEFSFKVKRKFFEGVAADLIAFVQRLLLKCAAVSDMGQLMIL
jgi:hypothetical protein